MRCLRQANITDQGYLAVPAVPGLQENTQQLIPLGLWAWPNIYLED